jgi:hypothetical protein
VFQIYVDHSFDSDIIKEGSAAVLEASYKKIVDHCLSHVNKASFLALTGTESEAFGTATTMSIISTNSYMVSHPMPTDSQQDRALSPYRWFRYCHSDVLFLSIYIKRHNNQSY